MPGQRVFRGSRHAVLLSGKAVCLDALPATDRRPKRAQRRRIPRRPRVCRGNAAPSRSSREFLGHTCPLQSAADRLESKRRFIAPVSSTRWPRQSEHLRTDNDISSARARPSDCVSTRSVASSSTPIGATPHDRAVACCVRERLIFALSLIDHGAEGRLVRAAGRSDAMSCPLRLLGCGWARRPILWSAGRGGTTRSGARPLVHQRRREQRADDGSRRMIGTSKPPRHGPRQRWPRSQRLARSDNDA